MIPTDLLRRLLLGFGLVLCPLLLTACPPQVSGPGEPMAEPGSGTTPGAEPGREAGREAGREPKAAARPSPRAKAAPPSPAAARSWAYWLQHPDLKELARSPYELIVVDYSADGTDERAFSAAQVQALKDAGKIVLAYFSIGEAEDYRFYWSDSWRKDAPDFLGPENPDWPGNFKVRYWEAGWWDAALRPYLERILAAGFDGVYLDIVDAYWFWHEEAGLDLAETAENMARLVGEIAAYARARAGSDFIVAPQNALGIIDSLSPRLRKRYLRTIDMVGLESLFFNIHSEEDQAYRLDKAEEFSQAGVPVFNIEYIDTSQYPAYREALRQQEFRIIPYASTPDRALDTLTLRPVF
jgi:cysteinyl-tRNA synthetase